VYKKRRTALFAISASILIILLLPCRSGCAVPFEGLPLESPAPRAFLECERPAGMLGRHAFPQSPGRAKKRTRKPLPSAESPESEKDPKPDPLTLVVSIADLKLKLNGMEVPRDGQPCFGRAPNYGLVNDSSNLSDCLRFIFQIRAEQHVYKRGMEQRSDLPEDERIEKMVYLRPGVTLKDDQVSKLIEDIKKVGARPVVVLNEREYKEKFGWLFDPILPKPMSGSLAPQTIEGGVLNGKAVSQPAPAYPSSPKALHLSGTVKVQVVIDESGKVVSARVLSGHPVFRKPSMDAALRAAFPPSILLGQAVRVKGVIVYNFVGQ